MFSDDYHFILKCISNNYLTTERAFFPRQEDTVQFDRKLTDFQSVRIHRKVRLSVLCYKIISAGAGQTLSN